MNKRFVNSVLYSMSVLLIALGINLFLLSEDIRFRSYVHRTMLAYFEQLYECRARADLIQLNLLTGTINLTHVTVTSPRGQHEWTWRSSHIYVHIPVLAWLVTGTLPLTILLDSFDLTTQLQGSTPAAGEHFRKMVTPSDTPTAFIVQHLALAQGYVRAFDPTTSCLFTLDATLDMIWRNNIITLTLPVQHTHLVLNEQLPVLDAKGLVNVSLDDPLGACTVDMHTTLHITGTYANNCYPCTFKGTWQAGKGTGVLSTITPATALAALTYTNNGTIECVCRIPLQLLALPYLNDKALVCAKLQGNIADSNSMRAQILIHDLYPGVDVASVWRLKNAHCYGLSALVYQQQTWLQGTVGFDSNTQHIHMYAYNSRPLPLITGTIAPGQAYATLQATRTGTGTLTGGFLTTDTTHPLALHGSITVDQQHYTVQGHCNTIPFAAHGNLYPLTMPHGAWGTSTEPLISYSADAHNPRILHGTIHPTALAMLLQRYAPAVQGSGVGTMTVQYAPPSITLTAHADGAWFLPIIGNTVHQVNLTAVADTIRYLLTVPHAQATLSKGTVTVTSGHVDTTLNGIFPITIDHCFVKPDEDLYALVSGLLRFTTHPLPLLQGTLTLHQGQYCKNVLAAELSTTLGTSPLTHVTPTPVGLALQIASEQPITVKTPFLSAQLQIDTQLGNTITAPALTGTLSLRNGALLFPYKPLYITNATLTFLPYQPIDPVINLTAKNTIKKYAVTLHVHGSIHTPVIRVESSPSLSSEQIIALLLTGSEKLSLAGMVPALFTQQLQQLLFSPAITNVARMRYLNTLIAPFKRVRFIPHLNNQHARGGIRAGLEITYNDNLRAYIQQNLTFTEDTYFEVDYQLSDHLSIKGIKDEHSDLGAEIEMRWKFK